MTFSAKFRLLIVAIALLPPLAIMSYIYFSSIQELETVERKEIALSFELFERYLSSIEIAIRDDAAKLIDDSDEFQRALKEIYAGRMERATISLNRVDLDFCEIVDTTSLVLASSHRPGMIGEYLLEDIADFDSFKYSVEYDRSGGHPAIVVISRVTDDLFMYSGRYFSPRRMELLASLLNAELHLHFDDDIPDSVLIMMVGEIYESENRYSTALLHPENGSFIMTAVYAGGLQKPALLNVIKTSAIVAIISVLLALAVGLYYSARSKREINNLVEATARVAGGDFNTPVMAYEEGEFAHLADSFTAMTLKLKEVQKKLSTTEKIAAWQTVGRKLAHEIKNPLTPILIAVDDLYRTYLDKPDQIDTTLKETAQTVKIEVGRMNRLLNEFVEFARMPAPVMEILSVQSFVKHLETVYSAEIQAGRLYIPKTIPSASVTADPDQVHQVLINLIKNGLEAADTSVVTLRFEPHEKNIIIHVTDTGPGFTEEKLANPFEPYATDKPDGTGLGLVICLRIMHDHGGQMDLYNHENGAGVTIMLPNERT